MQTHIRIPLPGPQEDRLTPTQIIARALVEQHGHKAALTLWPWSRASFFRGVKGWERGVEIGEVYQDEMGTVLPTCGDQSQFETISLESSLNLRLSQSQFETRTRECSLVSDLQQDHESQIETHHRHIIDISPLSLNLRQNYSGESCGDLIRFDEHSASHEAFESITPISAHFSAFDHSDGHMPRAYALHARDTAFARAVLKTSLRDVSSKNSLRDFKLEPISFRRGVLGGTSQNYHFGATHGKSSLVPPKHSLLQEILPMDLPTPPTPSPDRSPKCCNNKIIRISSIVYEGRRISVKPNSAPFLALGGAVVAQYSPEDFGKYWTQFWSTYPVRKGKVEAMQAFYQALVAGVDPAVILAGAEAYAAERKAEDSKPAARRSTPKWPQGWLNSQRWADYDGQAPRQETGIEALRRFTEAMEASQ